MHVCVSVCLCLPVFLYVCYLCITQRTAYTHTHARMHAHITYMSCLILYLLFHSILFKTLHLILIVNCSEPLYYFVFYLQVSKVTISERRAAAVSDFVGFSAGLTQPATPSSNSSLAFDRVWLNVGDGYDNSTGEFTCPRAGTYVFMFNGLANSVNAFKYIQFICTPS